MLGRIKMGIKDSYWIEKISAKESKVNSYSWL